MKNDNLLENAKYQLSLMLSFINIIDTRVSIILGLNFGALGILILNIKDLHIFCNWLITLPAIYTTLSILSLIDVYKCFFPRLDSNNNKSLVYFDAVSNREKGKFISEFKKISNSEYSEDILSQVWINSRIVNLKFYYLKCALISFILSLLPWLASLLILSVKNKEIALRWL